MKNSIALLEEAREGSLRWMEEREKEVCHSPEDFTWLKRYMNEIVEFLDYSEGLSKITDSNLEEDKNHAIQSIDNILATNHYEKYEEPVWKAISNSFGFNVVDRIRANMSVLELFQGAIIVNKHEEVLNTLKKLEKQ
ncbi:hypothetical protein [Bacillus sp. CGMCC 1.16541]|uniref:hypothetical protein n=1 Tax=Bacillus sp. CGMCC 1.16541 TaxID=2185143 RepID=UPI000D7270F3|nr:hypothetical protein [Bacillus sp. CGMCC 1.16541]